MNNLNYSNKKRVYNKQTLQTKSQNLAREQKTLSENLSAQNLLRPSQAYQELDQAISYQTENFL